MISNRIGRRSHFPGCRSVLTLFFLILAVSATGRPAEAAEGKEPVTGGKNPVIARVGQTSITIEDIEDKQINDLRLELHNRIQGKLQIAALEKLSQTHPEYRLDFKPEITEKDITDFYNENELQNRAPLAELKSRIQMLLQMKAVSEHYDALYRKAVQKGLIVSYLSEPNTFLVRVPTGSAFVWGQQREPVMVLEFSDYQCPFCSRIQATLTELRKKYSGRAAFAYRHAPLEFHEMADEAAIAAECARDQGKFKTYHKLLFKNYRSISPASFEQFAREAGVANIQQFNTCVTSEHHRGRVQADQQAAAEAGIRGTPGFIIGKFNWQEGVVSGEILSGAQPGSAFTQLIEKYLNLK